MIRRLGLLLAGALLLASCHSPSFDHLEFSSQSSTPDQASFSNREIVLAVGVAVQISATAYDDDGNEMEGDLSLESGDRQVVDVAPSSDGEAFVFSGTHEGQSGVRVVVGGESVGRIPVSIVAQRAR